MILEHFIAKELLTFEKPYLRLEARATGCFALFCASDFFNLSLCVVGYKNKEDANLMEELVTSINLNKATYWLKLKKFELAKNQCDWL